jgi:hypothetical protein
VGPRAVLNAVVKRKIPNLCRELNPKISEISTGDVRPNSAVISKIKGKVASVLK